MSKTVCLISSRSMPGAVMTYSVMSIAPIGRYFSLIELFCLQIRNNSLPRNGVA